MTFRRKVEHGVGGVDAQQVVHQLGIAYVAADKDVLRIVAQGGQIFQIARVGQLVQIDHAKAARAGQQYLAGADKARAAGDEQGGTVGGGCHGRVSAPGWGLPQRFVSATRRAWPGVRNGGVELVQKHRSRCGARQDRGISVLFGRWEGRTCRFRLFVR